VNVLGDVTIRFCSVSVTPSKARLIGFYYKWKFQSIATVRSSRVSLRSTQLLLTVAMGLESWSSNGDLLDGSTERRLTLAEVELTDVGPHFRLIVLHAMPEVTTFFERCVIRFAPCLCDTKQISADWLWLQVETPVRCRCASSRWSGYGVAHTDMKNLSEITW